MCGVYTTGAQLFAETDRDFDQQERHEVKLK